MNYTPKLTTVQMFEVTKTILKLQDASKEQLLELVEDLLTRLFLEQNRSKLEMAKQLGFEQDMLKRLGE